MAKSATKHLKEIFSQSQFSVTSHERLLKKSKQLYDTMSENDFTKEFISCLQVPLIHGEKHRAVENALNFASKFIASLLQPKPAIQSDEEDEEEICPFVLNVLKFLFENHHTEYQAIRFRVCQFINKILNGLGNEACIDDNLCDQISECMMERLQDKAPAVRKEAVLALHRLQDPMDANCPVMKAFIFHMKSDPNADVRRAVITNIAITSLSVKAILERTYDTKDAVRRTAYVTLSKLGVQRFSIHQRVRLLTDGFKDHSVIVRDCVSKVMLPSWLQFYKGSFLELLHALDCENSTEISSSALKSLFKSEPINVVLEELTKLLNEDKVIPIQGLSPEKVLYWQVLNEYLEAHPEIADDRPIDEPLPELLPELSTFCSYIKQYYEAKSVEDVEDWVKLQYQYILIHLLELCKGFDLADEMGRSNLQTLCLYFLTNNAVSEEVVPVVIQLLVRVVPNVEERLQVLAEAISEVREPMTEQEPELEGAGPPPEPLPTMTAEELRQKELKQAAIRVKINELKEEQDEAIRDQDFMRAQGLKEEYQKLQAELKALTDVPSAPAPPPDSATPAPRPEVRDPIKDEMVLRKCLRIVREMVQSESVKSLSATLRSLMQNFVLPCLQEDNSNVIRTKALEALGLFCLLDKSLAQENFLMFCFQIANDEVCEVALKVAFDLLLLYGLEPFQVQEESGETSTKKKSKKKKNLFVTDMFDDEFDTEEEESQESHTNISSGSSGNTSNLISMLTSLLDSASTSMRNLAMEGLYKLLMACRITSSALLSRLILMWYSPVTDGDESLRQPLGVFLTCYASHCPRSQETLEQAFLPTLKTLMQAPVTSPLTAVDQDSVARLFVSLTRPDTNKFHSKTSHIHNNMAISICNAVMDCDDSTNIGVLLRALACLELSLDDSVYREELKTLTKKLKEIFRTSKEKQFLRYIEKLCQIIETAENVSMRTTEVDNTAASSQFEGTETRMTINTTVQSVNQTSSGRDKMCRLLDPDREALIAENGNEDDEDDDNSQKLPSGDSDIVIPASPPRSQPSDSEDDTNTSEVGMRKTNKGVKVSTDNGVFKKPPARDNQRGIRTQDVSRNAAVSDSDASPVPKRRKASAEEKSKQPSDSTKLSKKNRLESNKLGIQRREATKGDSKASDEAGPSTQRNPKDSTKGTETVTARSPRRNIHPTEKGATLKTFQRLSTSGTSSSDGLSSPTVESARLAPIAKRGRNSAESESSQSGKEEESSTAAQASEVSNLSSPHSTSPTRSITRRSVSSIARNNSVDSPPSSAAVLQQLQSGKKDNRNQRKITRQRSASDSDQSSPHPQHSRKQNRKPSKASGSIAAQTAIHSAKSSSSGVDADSDASPPPRRHKKNDNATTVTDVTSYNSRSRAKSEVSPASATRSGLVRDAKPARKKSTFDTPASDSDSSPVPGKKPKRPVSQDSDSSQQSPRPIQSSEALRSVTDSDGLPTAAKAQPGKRGQRREVKGIEKLVKRAASPPMRVSRRSVSKSDLEATSQSSGNEPDLDVPRRTRRSVVESDSSGSLSMSKKKNEKEIFQAQTKKKSAQEKPVTSDSSPSPARRPPRGHTSDIIQVVKKRTAEVLKSTSSDSNSSSPQASRKLVKSSDAVNKSTPTQPEKKTRTKMPNMESPISVPSRRSLRSQTETPSPRTRSGKK